MSKVKRTPNQLAAQERFKEAIEYARTLINNPGMNPPFKLKKGELLYNAAVS